jgi:voltage-dependent potassium channel beta subunit
MEYRRLGATGLRLSAIGLGTWVTFGERLDDTSGLVLLDEAYQLGVNYFDCAETYGDGAAEEALGRALRSLAPPRETYVVSGKVYWGVHGGRTNTRGLSRKHIMEACHATLQRLQLDHLDLFLCHRSDTDTPLTETVSAMSDLIRQGKVLYWGTSEWPPERVIEAHALAGREYPPVVEQLQYNLFERRRVEHDFVSVIDKLALGITAWSPLAYGLLAGRYDQGFPPGARLSDPAYAWLRTTALGDDETGTLDRYRRVNALAREAGLEPASLALAWVLRNPHVTSAICGASGPDQLRVNVSAVQVGSMLDDELLGRLDDIVLGPPGQKGETSCR